MRVQAAPSPAWKELPADAPRPRIRGCPRARDAVPGTSSPHLKRRRGGEPARASKDAAAQPTDLGRGQGRRTGEFVGAAAPGEVTARRGKGWKRPALTSPAPPMNPASKSRTARDCVKCNGPACTPGGRQGGSRPAAPGGPRGDAGGDRELGGGGRLSRPCLPRPPAPPASQLAPRSPRPAPTGPASSREEPPTARRLHSPGLPGYRLGDLATNEWSAESGPRRLPEEVGTAPEVGGRAQEARFPRVLGGVLGGPLPQHAASGGPALAAPALRAQSLGVGGAGRRSVAEATRRAARGGEADLAARSLRLGKPVLEHRGAAPAGVVRPGAEGRQRPQAPLQAWGECTPAALPLLVAPARCLAASPPRLVVTSEVASGSALPGSQTPLPPFPCFVPKSSQEGRTGEPTSSPTRLDFRAWFYFCAASSQNNPEIGLGFYVDQV